MDTDKQIKRIVLDRMERCSVCHRDFEPDDVHVLSRKSDMWMLMVSCGECQAPVKRRERISNASGSEPARKKIQARQTKANVASCLTSLGTRSR